MSKPTPWEFVQDPQAGWDDLFTLKHHLAAAREWLKDSAECEKAFGEDLRGLLEFRVSNAQKDAEALAASMLISLRINEIK